MKLKKAALSLAVAGVIGLSSVGFVACNSGSSNPDAFELQIYAGGYGTEPWEYVLNLFQEDHPEVEIITYMDANANTQMADRWRNGDPPDFVFLDGSGLDRDGWVNNRLLYDCTEWLETATVNGSDERIIDVVGSQFFNRNTYSDGTTITYGMPILKNSYGVWYDQAWCTENELNVPTNIDGLKTFASEVKGIMADDGVTASSAMCYPGSNAPGYLVQGLILPAIGAYDDDEYFQKIITASDPDAFVDDRTVDVMQRFMDFVAAGGIMDGTISLDHTTSQFRWLRHDAALIPNGLWLRNELETDIQNGKGSTDEGTTDTGDQNAFNTSDMRYGASPLVLSTQKQTIVTTTVDCGVAAQGDQVELALEFLTYLYRPDVAKVFALAAETPSVVPITYTEEDNVSDSFAYAQAVLNSDEYLQVYKTGSWGAVDAEFNEIVNSIVAAGANQTTTALEYCQRLQTVAREQL